MTTYIDEIKKVTNQPIKYVIYSHSHYDHIAGGKPFKDLGATLRRAQERAGAAAEAAVARRRDAGRGGRRQAHHHARRHDARAASTSGRNHSDNSLVMRLPKEKLIFTVDFIPIQTLLFRNLPDTASPPEWEESLKRVAGARLGAHDPRPSLRRRAARHQAGCAGPASATCRTSRAEVKKAAAEGKCTDTAMKEIKLPKYEKWGNYATFLPVNVERYCYLNNGN